MSTSTEIHKLIHLYLTIPISSATSKRTLKKNIYLPCSSMTEKRLNNCIILHVHKELVDEMNPVHIA